MHKFYATLITSVLRKDMYNPSTLQFNPDQIVTSRCKSSFHYLCRLYTSKST